MTTRRFQVIGRNATDPYPMTDWQRERMEPAFADDRSTWAKATAALRRATWRDWAAVIAVVVAFVLLMEGRA